MKIYNNCCFVLFISANVLCANIVFAQSDLSNTVKLHASSMYISERLPGKIPFAQFGVSYERKVVGNFGVGLNFSRWTVSLSRKLEYYEPLIPVEITTGMLGYRTNYKSLNLYGFYKLKIVRSQYIQGGLGASYAWGTDGFIKTYSAFTQGNVIVCAISQYYYRKADYLGALANVSYDYSLLKNRVNVGVDARARYYKGFTPLHFDYGVHAGVSF